MIIQIVPHISHTDSLPNQFLYETISDYTLDNIYHNSYRMYCVNNHIRPSAKIRKKKNKTKNRRSTNNNRMKKTVYFVNTKCVTHITQHIYIIIVYSNISKKLFICTNIITRQTCCRRMTIA